MEAPLMAEVRLVAANTRTDSRTTIKAENGVVAVMSHLIHTNISAAQMPLKILELANPFFCFFPV